MIVHEAILQEVSKLVSKRLYLL